MTIATVGAFALKDFREGAAVMLFFQVGELFQTVAVEKSRKSITKLMELKPESVTVVRNGKTYELPPEDILKDEMIAVKTGERIPLDGIVTEGESELDTSALTGEFLPVEVKAGGQRPQWLNKPERTSQSSGHKYLPRVCSVKNSRYGAKLQRKKSQDRKVHHTFCKSLYPCGSNCCTCTRVYTKLHSGL